MAKIETVHIFKVWQEKWLRFKSFPQKLLFLIQET